MLLKKAIDALFSKHGLSITRLRGQGYDGASNMSGEFNGLKTLILKENSSAFYIHCFAHQLQLALVGVAKKHDIVGALLGHLLNAGTFFEQSNISRSLKHFKLENLQVDKDSIKKLKSSVHVTRVGAHTMKHEAYISLKLLQSFDFIFSLHLMRIILGVTHELSQALDDQDIVNAMDLVKVCKRKLQTMRENGWVSLLEEVVLFCGNENISVPNMDAQYVCPGKSKRRAPETTNMHYYCLYKISAGDMRKLMVGYE
ncbi:hypothetical protein ACLB2K_006434 [Fragaria x ananassa]